MTTETRLKQIVEAALLAAGGPLTLEAMQELFLEEERPDKRELREAIGMLQTDYDNRGMELVEVGGGFRINVRAAYAPWVSRLWEERPARYSRALLETLALVAYRQPITRGEIEEIRGVSVSTNIMKTLLERDWVRVVGQRDVPGKPSLYATTREFLNYFGLKSLDELPTLQEIRDLDSINQELVFDEGLSANDSTHDPSATGPIVVDIPLSEAPVEAAVGDDRPADGPALVEVSDSEPVDGEPDEHTDAPQEQPEDDETEQRDD